MARLDRTGEWLGGIYMGDVPREYDDLQGAVAAKTFLDYRFDPRAVPHPAAVKPVDKPKEGEKSPK